MSNDAWPTIAVRVPARPTIAVRVPARLGQLLEAVAYADLMARAGAEAAPSEINMSDFVRAVLDDVVNDYAEEQGGVTALMENLRAGEIRHVESQLHRLRECRDYHPLAEQSDDAAEVTKLRQTKVKT